MKIYNESKINEIIFLSDIHFGVHANSMEWNQNIKDYFDNFFIPFVIQEKNILSPIILIAGDYFESRQTLDISVMNTAMDIMTKLSELCTVYLLVGNHDIYKKTDLDITSLRIFKTYNNVHVIDNISVLKMMNNTNFLLVPWIGDPKKETEIINKNKKDVSAVILHTELSGMSYDNGRPIINGLNSDAIGDLSIISGHIHTRQEKKSGNIYKLYLGSPYQTKRSDIGNMRGIYTYKICEANTLQFTPNTYSPLFLKIRYDEFLTYDEEKISNILKNNYIDFIISKDQKSINTTKIVEDLLVYYPKDIKFVYEKDDTVKVDSQTVNDSDIAIDKVFSKYIRNMNLSDGEISELETMNKLFINQATE